ncbi:hypothetical protein [Mucilaginibacter sp.]|uniref:hypothetical protein n=1 Tax=Mucilaginibacter sp. TaxID=1882438 RepID=UPI003D12B194
MLYILVSILVMITYYYSLNKNKLIVEKILPGQSATIKAKTLKQFIAVNKGTSLENEGKQALLFLNISRFSIIGGIVAYVILMMLGK